MRALYNTGLRALPPAVLPVAIALLMSPCASPQAARDGNYVDGRVCASCHPAIDRSFRLTGMGRSFSSARPVNTVDSGLAKKPFYHKASDTWFTMILRDGRYFQRRYQIGFEGKETNIDEKSMDFVMGSGNHVRTYLHQTPAGAHEELPLAWYAEKGGYWAMNPGYDTPDQPDSRRKITYECMFCHNSYPEIPQGHEQLRAAPVYSGQLPEGIDCQRCHGPGGAHVRAAQARDPSPPPRPSATPSSIRPDCLQTARWRCACNATSKPPVFASRTQFRNTIAGPSHIRPASLWPIFCCSSTRLKPRRTRIAFKL